MLSLVESAERAKNQKLLWHLVKSCWGCLVTHRSLTWSFLLISNSCYEKGSYPGDLGRERGKSCCHTVGEGEQT